MIRVDRPGVSRGSRGGSVMEQSITDNVPRAITDYAPASYSPEYTYPARGLMLRGSVEDLNFATFRRLLCFSAEGAQFGAKPAIMSREGV